MKVYLKTMKKKEEWIGDGAVNKAMESKWVPKYWLVFLDLGKPKYVKLWDAFNSAHRSIGHSANAMASHLGKRQRRAAKRIAETEASASSSSCEGKAAGNDTQREIIHRIVQDCAPRDNQSVSLPVICSSLINVSLLSTVFNKASKFLNL